MSEVAAISGATGDDLAMLEQIARDFGKSTQFSASEAADALKYMALAHSKTSGGGATIPVIAGARWNDSCRIKI